MNSNLSIANVFLVAALLSAGCRGGAKEASQKGEPASPIALHSGSENYLAVDTAATVVIWKGANTFGAHTGYVHVSKGELLVENGELAGGAVEVDMNTIEDEKHESNNGLIDHLRDPDFFHVTKFPVAAIAITEVAPAAGATKNISGNLTIKGITRAVRFPAQVEVSDGLVKATGRLTIDRTHWGIHYASGKFFSLVADKAISDSIEFDINIVAKK